MLSRLPYVHVVHLVTELRRAAQDNQVNALAAEDGDIDLCLKAALMNDAADALESLLGERAANTPPPGNSNARDNGRY
jgi:hypothetical protein